MKKYVQFQTEDRIKMKSYCQIQLQMDLKKVRFGYFVVAAADFEETDNVRIIRVEYGAQFAI